VMIFGGLRPITSGKIHSAALRSELLVEQLERFGTS